MSTHSKRPVRDQRLAKIIENELSLILSSAADSRLQLVRIVRVVSRPGGRHFQVIYGPPPGKKHEAEDIEGPKEAGELLAKAHGYIRTELASSLNLKFAPELAYAPDPLLWAEWEQ